MIPVYRAGAAETIQNLEAGLAEPAKNCRF
jgi:hypothetical protein